MSSNVSKWPYQKVLPSTDIEHTVLPQRVTLSMFPLYSCASLAANIEHSVQPLSHCQKTTSHQLHLVVPIVTLPRISLHLRMSSQASL